MHPTSTGSAKQAPSLKTSEHFVRIKGQKRDSQTKSLLATEALLRKHRGGLLLLKFAAIVSFLSYASM